MKLKDSVRFLVMLLMLAAVAACNHTGGYGQKAPTDTQEKDGGGGGY